jgi:hypothetical protein
LAGGSVVLARPLVLRPRIYCWTGDPAGAVEPRPPGRAT